MARTKTSGVRKIKTSEVVLIRTEPGISKKVILPQKKKNRIDPLLEIEKK